MPKLKKFIILSGLVFTLALTAEELTPPIKPELDVKKRLQVRAIKVVFEPIKQTVISSEIEGKIISIPHKLGEAVSDGALLVALDPRRSEAAYEKAQVELEHLKQTLEAIEELYQFGDESKLKLIEAQTSVQVKEIEAEYARLNFESATITSPFAGQVAELLVEEYENIEKGKPLLKLIDSSGSKGRALLPANLIDKVSVGQEVYIQLGHTNKRVKGHVSHIAPYIDPTSATVKMIVEVKDPDVLPGTIGYLLLDTKE